MEITAEMVVAWKSDAVTKAVLQAIFEEREQAKEYLACGASLEDDNATAQIIGRCQGYDHVTSIIEDLKVSSISEEIGSND